MKSQTIPGDTPSVKPQGGYVPISTLMLGMLWWAYLKDRLSLRAARVGLALFELRIRRTAHACTERRRGKRPDFIPHYSAKELADFCGLPEKRVKAALKELLALGLLVSFTESGFSFAPSPEALALSAEERDEFRAWFALLTRRKRVPVPRRILALACESPAPAVIAVILGACLRCSWLRPGQGFSFSGRLSCAWLAARFGISLRAVQKAKEHLVALGWLRRTGDINRAGERVAINPTWSRLSALPEVEDAQDRRAGEPMPAPLPEGQAGTTSAGVSSPTGTTSAQVSLTGESLPSEETKHPRESRADERPEQAGPGISSSQSGPEEKTPKAGSQPLPPPQLSRIGPEDFQDTGRALELFRQAVECGLMPNDSEHSRLLWTAAIERARTVPATNPAGLFLFLVKHRKWDFLSEGHFEAANARLKAYLHGPPRAGLPLRFVPFAPASPLGPASPRPRLSNDALLVQAVRNELAQRGLRCEVFAVLRAQGGWDRARYEAALAELAGTGQVGGREAV